MRSLLRFLKDEQGQDLIEYTLLMAFIALANGGPPAPVVDFAKFRQDFIANLGGNPAFEKYVRTPCYLPCEPADGFPGADALDLRSQQVLQKLEERPDLVTPA